MVKMGTFLGMSVGAFAFWHSMDKVHVWIALHQDEKITFILNFAASSLIFIKREREEKELEVRRMRAELVQQAKQSDSLA